MLLSEAVHTIKGMYVKNNIFVDENGDPVELRMSDPDENAPGGGGDMGGGDEDEDEGQQEKNPDDYEKRTPDPDKIYVDTSSTPYKRYKWNPKSKAFYLV